jgi:hypothetical protein
VYPPGNPHHVYEYEPEEFEQALSKRFAHVTLHRQTAWLASAILADPEFAAEGSEETIAPRTVKTEPREAGRETFTIALASQAEMPSPQSLVMLGDTFEVSWWESQVRGAGSEAREAAAQAIGEREAARRELASLQQALKSAQRSSLTSAQKLLAAEEKLAQATARVFALEAAHADLIERQRELQARIVRADEVLEAVKSSWSWRLTAPLRRLRPGRR